MKRNTVGGLYKENVLRETYLLNSGTALHTITPSLEHLDGCSFVVAIDNVVRVIAANGTTDHVVSGTKTWTLSAGNFGQGDVGGTFVINTGLNAGSYVIATVIDATHVTSVGAPAANETFGGTVTATLTDLALVAVPTVQVSNNFSPAAGTAPTLGQVPNAGRWPDITSAFSPAPATTNGTGEQFFQAYPLVAMRARLTLTPSAGAGYVSIYYCAKGNS
jgi:hypothetical protein